MNAKLIVGVGLMLVVAISLFSYNKSEKDKVTKADKQLAVQVENARTAESEASARKAQSEQKKAETEANTRTAESEAGARKAEAEQKKAETEASTRKAESEASARKAEAEANAQKLAKEAIALKIEADEKVRKSAVDSDCQDKLISLIDDFKRTEKNGGWFRDQTINQADASVLNNKADIILKKCPGDSDTISTFKNDIRKMTK